MYFDCHVTPDGVLHGQKLQHDNQEYCMSYIHLFVGTDSGQMYISDKYPITGLRLSII